MALLGTGCGSSGDSTTTTLKHTHKHRSLSATTTTTTHTPTTAAPKLASGTEDKAACTTFATIGNDAHKSHHVIAVDFRKLFRDMKHAENKDLRKEGHRSAVDLLSGKIHAFKTAFYSIFLICDQMGAP